MSGFVAGRNGVTRVTPFDPSDFPSKMAAEVKEFRPDRRIDRKAAARMDRFTHFVVAAADNHNEGETPLPIPDSEASWRTAKRCPNTEVKPLCAHGTASEIFHAT